jgi:FtsP/CotA-like multicopper oxidase with cupredoxin domain
MLAVALALPATAAQPYVPVVTPNGRTLPYKLDHGVKVFHLVAEQVKREIAPGMVINAWGYNGQTPGPTIEAVEGDRVRILVTNHLPEDTSVHWHGVLLPNGMDGVQGLTQPHIKPGETFAYQFTLRQSGTQMYHPHADETLQMALGMEGFFIIHPRKERVRIDRDFAVFLHEWDVPFGGATPNPATMLDFNLFTFNARAFPGTDALVVKKGQRVRVRLANLSMDSHPIHIHGVHFVETGTDGGPTPPSAQVRETTVNLPPGTTRDIEFVADAPGDWAMHCHKNHHTMNQMAHDVPNLTGVDQSGVEEKVRKLLPGYMAMGQTGMADMMEMGRPRNTLPMMTGEGQFGSVDMGGMFTVVKVREGITSYADPGFYKHPPGTVARKVADESGKKKQPAPEHHDMHHHGGTD